MLNHQIKRNLVPLDSDESVKRFRINGQKLSPTEPVP